MEYNLLNTKLISRQRTLTNKDDFDPMCARLF